MEFGIFCLTLIYTGIDSHELTEVIMCLSRSGGFEAEFCGVECFMVTGGGHCQS